MPDEQARLITPQRLSIDADNTLRPNSLKEYIGQEEVKKPLKVFIEAAKKRKEAIDHIIFYGPPGLGKTTLARIIANEMGVNIKTTSGPAIEKQGDLCSILTNLEKGDILFIDEIHRLNKTVEEVLYPALEDYAIDLIIGKGPSARTLRLDVPPFTLIGATTRMGLISSPLRDRFGIHFRLNFYEQNEIEQIIKRSANVLGIKIEAEAAKILSRASRCTPRIANRILRRVRDYAEINSDGIITGKEARQALKMLRVDQFGLDEIDILFLKNLIKKFNGGPAGLKTISSVLSEDIQTIEDVYEPYLLRMGLIIKTAKGRIATEKAYQYLKIKMPNNIKRMF